MTTARNAAEISTPLTPSIESETSKGDRGVISDIRNRYAASTVLDAFSEVIHDTRGEVAARSQRVFAIMQDFTAGKANNELGDAVVLRGINEFVSDKLFNQNVNRAVNTYFALQNDPLVAEYIDGIMLDKAVIDQFCIKTREKGTVNNMDLRRVLTSTRLNEASPNKDMWTHGADLADPKEMLELLNEVNLESVLIEAAAVLDDLQHPNAKKAESYIFRKTYDAESFYAPLCELTGFDALASALRSQVQLTRLERTDNGRYIKEAEEMIAMMNDTDIEAFVGELTTDYVGEGEAKIVVDNQSEHGVMMGDGMNIVDGKVVRSVWRLKTVGSLAEKLYRKKRKNPKASSREIAEDVKDIVGITFITDDESQSLELFRHVVENIEVDSLDNSDTDMVLHLRGERAFNDAFLQTGLPFDKDKIDVNDSADDFQWAKVTLRHEGVPVEIQVITEETRRRGRLHERASHLVYSYKKAHPDTELAVRGEDLEAIHARRDRINTPGLTEASKERVERVRARVGRSIVGELPNYALQAASSKK